MGVYMEKLITTIPIIITIFGGVYAVFKKMDSEFKEYLRRYYKNILEPFYYSCIINKKGVYDFFIEKEIIPNHFEVIPTYIYKLVKDNTNEAEEMLRKIMIVDFVDNRPSKTNSIFKSTMIMIDIGDYIAFLLLLFIFPTTVVLALIAGVGLILQLLAMPNTSALLLGQIIKEIVFIILLIGVMMFALKIGMSSIKEYTYSLSKKNVEKMIDSKLKKYNNLNVDLFE